MILHDKMFYHLIQACYLLHELLQIDSSLTYSYVQVQILVLRTMEDAATYVCLVQWLQMVIHALAQITQYLMNMEEIAPVSTSNYFVCQDVMLS